MTRTLTTGPEHTEARCRRPFHVYVVEGYAAPDALMDQIYSLRATVFDGELGWVPSEDGREFDAFDTGDATYVVAMDRQSRLIGTARLMSCSGPTLMNSVFADTVPDAAFYSPFVWETSRFCIADGWRRRPDITLRMAGAGMMFAAANGAETLLANCDTHRLRAFRTFGLPMDVIGETRAHSVPVYLALTPCTVESAMHLTRQGIALTKRIAAPGRLRLSIA